MTKADIVKEISSKPGIEKNIVLATTVSPFLTEKRIKDTRCPLTSAKKDCARIATRASKVGDGLVLPFTQK